MVNTVRQAREAAARGADVIIAQGSESGGFTGDVSTLCLLPQVVEAVSEIPVVAAGGIMDGRGLAVALLLGAQGVNIGTRFVASAEARVSAEWQRRIVEAESEDTVQLTFANAIIPPAPGSYDGLRPRVLRTAFVDEWNDRPAAAEKETERLSSYVMELAQQGDADQIIPFTGQTAGMIHEVLPVAEIVRRVVAEAEEVLRAAPDLAQ
jgi:enoyl-[acyl-carrier protein] reductase II